MKIIFTKKKVEPGDEMVVYAPSLREGETVKIVRTGSLDPFRIGLCEGEIPSLETPRIQEYDANQYSHNTTANAYKGYKKLKVKE